MKKDSDNELVLKLYNKYKKVLYAYAYRLTNNPFDADDLTQDTFTRIIEKIHLIRSIDENAMKAYLIIIMHNQHVDNLSRQKYTTIYMAEFADELTVTTDTEVINKIIMEMAKVQINHLPNTYKHIALLRYMENKTIKEISKLTNAPTGTVGVYLVRIIKMLKERLGITDENELKK